VSSPEEPLDEREEPVEPEWDPEVPEADALDQAREVEAPELAIRVDRAIETPEADALDQAREVPLDEDEDPGSGGFG
jgi:hypothetical protein